MSQSILNLEMEAKDLNILEGKNLFQKGGPDGGDGGRGGHIILRGNKQLWTLLHLKYKKHFIAENGKPGGGSKKNGANGNDIIIEVPLGTIARKKKMMKKF